MKKGKWQVFSQVIANRWLYQVGRVIDPTEPIHGGNVEYEDTYGCMADRADAERVAEMMNAKEVEE